MTVPVEGFVAPEFTRTEGFVIRPYRAGDGILHAAATNGSYEHLKAAMSWASPGEADPEEDEVTIQRFAAQYAALENFCMGIWKPDETGLLGGCGFHLREGALESRCVETGMWVRGDAAGQGLGSAVLKELVRWGFTEWPWLRIAWRCNSENLASRGCAEKAGLSLEGLLRGQYDEVTGGRRDTACYAILREEWAVDPG